ncbi:MAG: pullulanase-type alpha-1,6-glucosidase [Burkholderiales bacterium]|nr:pullulanase-type alpha-1,6-glucosidase [Burkholderiales bacterium]
MGLRFDREGGIDRRASGWRAWVLGLLVAAFGFASAAVAAPGVARIHYHRDAADYGGWQLYTWYGALYPSPQWNPAQAPTGSDGFGVYYDVALKTSDSGLNWILHDASGNNKNCGNDRYQPFPADVASVGIEIWQLQDDCTIYLAAPPFRVGNVAQARGHFLDRQTLAWPGASAALSYRLYFAPAGGITTSQAGVAGGQWLPLTVQAGGLSPALRAKFPHLAGALALTLAADQASRLPQLLRGQLVLAAYGANGLVDATSLQLPGVLDDLYRFKGRLGAVVAGRGRDDDDADEGTGTGASLQFRVWAPTAQTVSLKLYDSADGPVAQSLPMRFDARTGVWSAAGDSAWANRRYYQYEVAVYTRSLDRVVVNDVADPYSLGAAPGNGRSLIVDLSAPALKPAGWQRERPDDDAPQDIVLYETHIRDFSASDLSVPAADRGKYRAFSYANTNGMHHLRALRRAGLTHVHLLPAFETASVPDSGCITPVIPAAAADSTLQQAALEPVRDQDCFNWGYDPVLYTVPSASYASSALGTARVLEFRQMVQGLHDAGLRVVMDVVFNHTSASGQNPNSILDKIVPGYYYRLGPTGAVLTDSCCQDTASEHAMMGKLLIDSVLTWARQYHVDGFRFDLMSFTPKAVMLELKARLARIDPSIYLYGEGWNFGSVGNDARFVQATQLNMAGSGIGTFNDRLRDAVRGGGPFDGGSSLVANQGFINGLWLDPNALNAPATSAQRDALNRAADFVRLGLTGTLRDFVFTDKDGHIKTGAQIDYFGQPAGYAANPADVVNYISAHDNTTIFDNDQFKLPVGTSMADRVRVNSLGVAVLALSQGVAFFHAGDDLLRSKSLDANSYNSGDWFNRLDLSYQSSNWGVGLPPAFAGNAGNWSVMQPLLANPALKPGPADIAQAHAVFMDWLRLRRSTPLLHLASGAEVKRRVSFANVGPGQVPGLVVMGIDDTVGRELDPRVRSLVAVINVAPGARSFVLPGYAGRRLVLHPVQAGGADPVVKTSRYDPASGTVTVPARTAAVFIESR